MKRFISTVFGVAIFFVGVGALVEKTGAKFKSDDRALELIQKARQAIGGDSAIRGIKSLRIVGQTTRNFRVKGLERSESGQTEIALQFPDKMMRSTNIGSGEQNGLRSKSVEHSMDVVVTNNEPGEMKVRIGEGTGEGRGVGMGNRVVIRKDDGTVQEMTGADAEKWIAEHRAEGDGNGVKIVVKKADGSTETISGDGKLGEQAHNGMIIRKMKDGELPAETHSFKVDGDNVLISRGGPHAVGIPRNNDMLRLTLSLLLTAPEVMDVEYTYGGEGDIDGTGCNIVNASFGGQTYRLYLDRSSNLPVATKFKGGGPQVFAFRRNAEGAGDNWRTSDLPGDKADGEKTVTFTAKVPDGADGEKGNIMYKRIDGGPMDAAPEA